jgi:Arc/MetJ family transcription regulator
VYIYREQKRISMPVRKTSVEIDEELMEGARRILGTTTLKETVEGAFLRLLQEEARREEVEALSTMRGMDLDDPEVMAKAWRT